MTCLLDTNAISELMRADPRVEKWMFGLNEGDRIVTCPIVRGEILFGSSRLPVGRRRSELEQAGNQLLNAFHCEPIPEIAGDFYAAIKLTRHSRGLALDENDLWVAATALALDATLVSRDKVLVESRDWLLWSRRRIHLQPELGHLFEMPTDRAGGSRVAIRNRE